MMGTFTEGVLNGQKSVYDDKPLLKALIDWRLTVLKSIADTGTISPELEVIKLVSGLYEDVSELERQKTYEKYLNEGLTDSPKGLHDVP